MKSAPPHPQEAERIRALRDTDLLDTEPEQGFDDLVQVASTLCGTPMAVVSLVDTDRQWFKAKVGVDASETPRDVAFCAHAIHGEDLFVVENALEDERFHDNPLVTGDLGLRFYAGTPLISPEGYPLGTLCVLDRTPRQLTAEVQEALEALGRQVVSMIELRRANRALQVEVEARKQAQEEVARFFDVSLSLLCVADVEGRFQRLNPAWVQALGYPLDALEGSPYMSYVHPDDVAATETVIHELAKGVPAVGFVHRFRRSDGTYRVLEWRAAPDPNTGLLYAAANDITDRVRSAEQTRALLEASATGMVVVGPDGTVTHANREAERLLGHARAELLGMDVRALIVERDQDRLHALRRDFAGAPVDRPIGSGLDFFVQRADGGEVPVEVALTALHLGQGPSTVVTLVDLSTRHAVEQMKNEFVSVVSHELRTPLTSIRGSLRLLEAGVKGPLPEGVKQLVSIASANTERLIRLINDILDIEKIEAGKLELNLETTSARTLCRTAVDNVRGMADAAGVDIEVEAPAALSVTVDTDRVVQVLVNLLSNAVKFSDAGSAVQLRAFDDDGTACFEVRDHGPGIAPDDLGRLFGKFQQLDASDTRARGGTGLGLAISKAIAEAHGGRIEARSDLGDGATFRMELATWSMAAFVEEEDTGQVPARAVPEGRPLALLVEDDPDAATVVAGLLEQESLEVVVADSLRSARKRIAELEPAVVFLDLHLPDGHGFQLVEWMRARAPSQDTPVIAVSGAERPEGTQAPFLVDWLAKPLDGEDLSRAIARAALPHAKPRVLIVEDDPSMRAVLSEKVSALGARPTVASDGREALGHLQTQAADLIILDVGLPIVDGYSIVDILRRGPHRHTPLIVYSGRDLDTDEREALRLGVTHFVTKASADDGAFMRSVRSLLASVLDP